MESSVSLNKKYRFYDINKDSISASKSGFFPLRSNRKQFMTNNYYNNNIKSDDLYDSPFIRSNFNMSYTNSETFKYKKDLGNNNNISYFRSNNFYNDQIDLIRPSALKNVLNNRPHTGAALNEFNRITQNEQNFYYKLNYVNKNQKSFGSTLNKKPSPLPSASLNINSTSSYLNLNEALNNQNESLRIIKTALKTANLITKNKHTSSSMAISNRPKSASHTNKNIMSKDAFLSKSLYLDQNNTHNNQQQQKSKVKNYTNYYFFNNLSSASPSTNTSNNYLNQNLETNEEKNKSIIKNYLRKSVIPKLAQNNNSINSQTQTPPPVLALGISRLSNHNKNNIKMSKTALKTNGINSNVYFNNNSLSKLNFNENSCEKNETSLTYFTQAMNNTENSGTLVKTVTNRSRVNTLTKPEKIVQKEPESKESNKPIEVKIQEKSNDLNSSSNNFNTNKKTKLAESNKKTEPTKKEAVDATPVIKISLTNNSNHLQETKKEVLSDNNNNNNKNKLNNKPPNNPINEADDAEDYYNMEQLLAEEEVYLANARKKCNEWLEKHVLPFLVELSKKQKLIKNDEVLSNSRNSSANTSITLFDNDEKKKF
jgi:hypothetical protein